MSTLKQVVGTKAALTVTGLSTLASATYAVSAAIDNTTNQPVDMLVEVNITPGTVSGSKQALVFAKSSLDGSGWQSGPESGTSSTDEPNLTRLGVVPLATASGAQSKTFSVAAAFGGVLPPHLKIVIRNDSGAAFTAASVNTSEVSISIVA